LEMGTDSNLRMLATVRESRWVTIVEEPSPTSQPYLIKADGDWHDPYGQSIRKELCPVGVYARMKNVIPPSVDSSAISDPAIMFIEENANLLLV